jgi:multidrug efflux pump subunit AcrA (membrane-fusion protein)
MRIVDQARNGNAQRESRRHRLRVLWTWAIIGALGVLGGASYCALRPKPVPLSARFRTQAVTLAVVEVRNSPVVVQDVITYGTVIDAENLDLALKPGMTASVRIRTASVPEAARVSNAALHFNPPHEPASKTPGVWIMEGDQLRRVRVHPGISDGELTAVEHADLPPKKSS